jgi:hypothetical protein
MCGCCKVLPVSCRGVCERGSNLVAWKEARDSCREIMQDDGSVARSDATTEVGAACFPLEIASLHFSKVIAE